MRFKTEFKNDGTKYDDALTDHRKEWRQNELGKIIADAFGWTGKGVASSDSIKFSLEIEAFPMDKWIEFKNKLLFEIQESAIHGIPISPIRTLELIKDLEFYSNNKQSVESWLGNV